MSHPLSLDRLPVGRVARIAHIDWARLDSGEARRIREFGIYEGMDIEILHRGSLFFRDPLAIRIGRMRVVMRAVHAAAISLVAPEDAAQAASSPVGGLSGA
ncbi:FeoA family protein [Sphingomonas lacunae]